MTCLLRLILLSSRLVGVGMPHALQANARTHPGIKKEPLPQLSCSKFVPCPTTRVLLVFRQAACTTAFLSAMPTAARSHVFYSTSDQHRLGQFVSGDSPQNKKLRSPPQPDHTCFTRLPTSTDSDSLGLGPAQENDPWRFRQQSSRVISIQFWYLTSWLPRFLLDQTLSFYTMAFAKLVSFRRIFKGLFWLLLSWEPVA